MGSKVLSRGFCGPLQNPVLRFPLFTPNCPSPSRTGEEVSYAPPAPGKQPIVPPWAPSSTSSFGPTSGCEGQISFKVTVSYIHPLSFDVRTSMRVIGNCLPARFERRKVRSNGPFTHHRFFSSFGVFASIFLSLQREKRNEGRSSVFLNPYQALTTPER